MGFIPLYIVLFLLSLFVSTSSSHWCSENEQKSSKLLTGTINFPCGELEIDRPIPYAGEVPASSFLLVTIQIPDTILVIASVAKQSLEIATGRTVWYIPRDDKVIANSRTLTYRNTVL